MGMSGNGREGSEACVAGCEALLNGHGRTSSLRKQGPITTGVSGESKMSNTVRNGTAAAYGFLLSQERRLLHQLELQQQGALDHGKIVVGDHGQHGVALRRHVGVDAFHVVDLLAQISLEDRGPVDHGARRHR